MANSSNSKNIVLFTLAMADRPLTINDIMFRCGVSYNTVKRAVYGNPRIRQEEGYPATFTATKPDAFDPNVIMIKYDKPQEGWITWLDEIRPLLVSITALSDTMGKEEREKKANMFKSLGRSFLSLGKDIERLIDNDEWAHYLDWSDE